ncbi:parathyroid hormone [Vombatus ursinus]|uniref:parathyroid hormone n=1 Tax=Vombatus ursinus TaxID=29139 RepID=UPI000FFD137E|nr:parathyroid hormone [Vombatus ursinus]
MVFARDVARAIVVLYVIGFITNADGKSIKKRLVAEIELMHNYSEFLKNATRVAWLKKYLEGILDPRAPAAPAETQPRKRADTSLVANQDYQLTPGKKTLGKTDKADTDILSKVNPHLE